MAWKITVVLVLILAAFGAGYGTSYLESKRYIDGLDQQFGAAREYFDGIDQQNRDLKERISKLSGQLDTASNLVDQISNQGGTALETVRRVIANLKKLKEILRTK